MHLIDVISSYSILVPALAGAFLFKQVPKVLKVLCVYIFVAFAIEVAIFITAYWGMHNLFLFHAYTYFEYVNVAIIFYLLAETKVWKRTILFLSIGFLSFSAINSLYFEELEQFNSNQRYLHGIVIIIFCAGYFTKLIKKLDHIYLEKHPYFIYTGSYLIYVSGTFSVPCE